MGDRFGKYGDAKDMTVYLRGMTIPWHNNHNRETARLKNVPHSPPTARGRPPQPADPHRQTRMKLLGGNLSQ